MRSAVVGDQHIVAIIQSCYLTSTTPHRVQGKPENAEVAKSPSHTRASRHHSQEHQKLDAPDGRQMPTI